jgi:hypothetical protein
MEINDYQIKIFRTDAGYYLTHRPSNQAISKKFYPTKSAMVAEIDNINIANGNNTISGMTPGGAEVEGKVTDVVTLFFCIANGGGTINGVIGVLQRQGNPHQMLTVFPSSGLLSTYLNAFTF